MTENTKSNRRYKREVKALMAEKGIKYTEALRIVKARHLAESPVYTRGQLNNLLQEAEELGMDEAAEHWRFLLSRLDDENVLAVGPVVVE